MSTLLKVTLSVLGALVLGYGLGYFYAPDKIKIEEKIVEKEVTKKEEYTKKTKKYDKAGKVKEEIEEIGTKETNTESKKTDKITEKEKTRKMWAVKGGVAINPRDLSSKLIYRIGSEVRLPIFDSWVGAEADVNINRPLLGAYIRLEF